MDVLSLSLSFPLSEMRPHSRSNDLLVKYTPASICAELEDALCADHMMSPERYILEGEPGSYYDLNLPTMYPGVTYDRAIERRIAVSNLFARITECNVFVLTLGLIEHWFDKELGRYIATDPNKALISRYPDRFEFRQLGYVENSRFVERAVEMVAKANPTVRIILTTSPVPLMQTFTDQDVIIANSYSKSILRTISQEVAQKYSFVDYFPSYEMVTMSPPDVAWDNDLRHVRDSMVGIVMKKFFETYFGDEARVGDISAAYGRAKLKLDRSDLTAIDDFRILEDKLKHDKAFVTSYCQAAITAKLAPEADRISLLLIERFPGAWSDILRARALMLYPDYAGALQHLKRAKEYPNTLYHAGGWEMEIGRLTADVAIELSGACSVVDAICSEFASADKKPWIKKRMLNVLRREERYEELERVKRYL